MEMKVCIGAPKAGDSRVRLTDPHESPLTHFYKNSQYKDGHVPVCKSCKKVYETSKKERTKLTPPDYITCRECGETKPCEQIVNNSSTRTGKDKICKECSNRKSSDYKRQNPEVRRFNEQSRRDKLRSLPNEKVSKERLLEIHGPNCYLCGEVVPEDLGKWDLEHIIPTSRGQLGTTYENCRVACRKCNGSKYNKTIHEWIGEDWDRYAHVDPEAYNRTMLWHVQNTPEIFA